MNSSSPNQTPDPLLRLLNQREGASTTSPKKIASNRRNAAKSTGPKTVRGKLKSSLNALTQGLFAETPLLPGERLDQYSDLDDAINIEFQPEGAFEDMLVGQLIDNRWRLRRTDLAEREYLMEVRRKRFERIQGHFTPEENALLSQLEETEMAGNKPSNDSPRTLRFMSVTGRPFFSKVPSKFSKAFVDELQAKISAIDDLDQEMLEAMVGPEEKNPLQVIDARRRALKREIFRDFEILRVKQSNRAK